MLESNKERVSICRAFNLVIMLIATVLMFASENRAPLNLAARAIAGITSASACIMSESTIAYLLTGTNAFFCFCSLFVFLFC
jgi:hypothetical protein